jgi:hypothetical protein
MTEKKIQKVVLKKFSPSKYVEVNPTLERDKKSKAMLTMGDYSPPSIADQRLVETLKKYAKLYEADTYVFVSNRDVSEGYLDEQQRIGMSQSVFGNIVYPSAVPTILEALKVCEDEYNSVVIVCMQEEAYDVSNVVAMHRDELRFESIDIVPYSDPGSYDVIAEHAIRGDFTSFKQSLAMPLRPSARDIFEAVVVQLDGLSEGYLTEKIRPIPYSERIKKAQTMRRYAKRIEIARERAAERRASPEKLRERARKRALEIIRSRILRNKDYAELSVVEKNALDARLMNIPPAVIERIAKRLLPVVRKVETERLSRSHSHHVSLSASATGHRGHVNEAFKNYTDAVFESVEVLTDLNQLIEALETSNTDRVRSVIASEKKVDAVRHHRMMTNARHADVNKRASKRFADIRDRMNEADDLDPIQTIIKRELERKNMLAALKDYEATPDIDGDAGSVTSKYNLDPEKAKELEKLYNRYRLTKGHKAYLNTFDVTESLDPEESIPDQREWGTDSLTDIYKRETPGQVVEEKHKPKGLWYNIRKRREKGLRRLRPGEKGYPKTLDIEDKS